MPNGRYVTIERKGLWHVWDALTQTTLSVVPLEIEVDSLGRPALSDDGTVLTFIGKEEGAIDNSLFIYKRHDSSYVMVQRFLIGCPAPILSASSSRNYVAILCQGQVMQIRDINDGHDRTPEGQKI